MTETAETGDLSKRLLRWWTDVMSRPTAMPPPGTAPEASAVAATPVVWLIGKVQSGKSSIVAAVTGCSDAEIGSGFRPCTRTARIFDFPAELPAIRFLDTRGLGETGYLPAEDLAIAERSAHLMLVVMRALDHQQDEVIEAVAAVRRRHPGWPIVVAQTCLHDAYRPGTGHVLPYPFPTAGGPSPAAGAPPETGNAPDDLVRSLAAQREAVMTGVPGAGPVLFVPIDLTRPGDGLEPRLYGLDALLAAIGEAAPASIAATLLDIAEGRADRDAAKAHPTILGHAAAAAAADILPVAGAVAVPGIQARLLHTLASERGVPWDRQALTEFGACLGAGILTRLAARFGIRQLVKLVPVYGQTIGSAASAASSFATTYALGRAALVFLDRRQRGETDPAAVVAAYKEALEKALGLARKRGIDGAEATAGKGEADAKR